jgi:hypothetical protein
MDETIGQQPVRTDYIHLAVKPAAPLGLVWRHMETEARWKWCGKLNGSTTCRCEAAWRLGEPIKNYWARAVAANMVVQPSQELRYFIF